MQKDQTLLWEVLDGEFLRSMRSGLFKESTVGMEANLNGVRVPGITCRFRFADGHADEIEGELNLFSNRVYLALYFVDNGVMDEVKWVRLDQISGANGPPNLESLYQTVGSGAPKYPSNADQQ